MNNRLSYIDYLKGFAIIGVIFIHFCLAFKSPIPGVNAVSAIGARCPQLFFILSAYLTWASLSKSGKVNTKQFLLKRFIKIAPLFYIALLLTALVPVMKETSFLNVITHITFMNGLFPEYTNSMMKIEWYIADLALFYFMAPVLFKYVNSLRSSTIAFGIATIANNGFTLITNSMLADQIANNPTYENYFHTFCIINQLPVLLIGIVLYYLNKYLNSHSEEKNRILIYCAFAIALFLGAYILFHLNKKLITSSFVAALQFGLLFLYLSNIQRFRAGYLLPLLGKHSFGMYCFHMLLINCLKHVPYIAQNANNIFVWSVLLIIVFLLSFYLGWGAEIITNIKYPSSNNK